MIEMGHTVILYMGKRMWWHIELSRRSEMIKRTKSYKTAALLKENYDNNKAWFTNTSSSNNFIVAKNFSQVSMFLQIQQNASPPPGISSKNQHEPALLRPSRYMHTPCHGREPAPGTCRKKGKRFLMPLHERTLPSGQIRGRLPGKPLKTMQN